jgi:hypothetical protein
MNIQLFNDKLEVIDEANLPAMGKVTSADGITYEPTNISDAQECALDLIERLGAACAILFDDEGAPLCFIEAEMPAGY